MTLCEKAYQFAIEAHDGQTDKAGKPYIEHVLTVASSFEDDDARYMTALLHDIIEDTGATLDDLRGFGIPDEVIAAVDAITKRDGVAYTDYLARVKSNGIARDVKIADLKHNSDLSRLDNVSLVDYARAQKYRAALILLETE
jgi:(p)ppGpp synthase/HD superfamily hydrolase